MASVLVNGHPFMDGNSWDFRPQCHGGFHYELAKLHGGWLSAGGLAETIRRCLESQGTSHVTIVGEEYDWMAVSKSFGKLKRTCA